MRSLIHRKSLYIGTLAAFLLVAAPLSGFPKKVRAQLKGKLFFGSESFVDFGKPLASTAGEVEQMANHVFRRASRSPSSTWDMHIIAFLETAPKSRSLSIDFYDGKKYVAGKRLLDVDPRQTALSSFIELSEDDGLSPQKTYQVRVSVERNGKEHILAKGSVEFQ